MIGGKSATDLADEMLLARSCGRCAYWAERFARRGGTPFSACLRRSPEIHPRFGIANFPTTYSDQFCGDFLDIAASWRLYEINEQPIQKTATSSEIEEFHERILRAYGIEPK